jgi:formate hydrogenlyase subunit 3/multisubunit Na+/H+ antiporter MnhD subunit
MPNMPDFPDLSWDRIPLGPFDDRLWWLLIGLCVALLFTIQAIETAIEGAWPHQRRTSRLIPRDRSVQMSWGFVALLVIPGALLLIGIVAVLIWRDPERPEQLGLGAVLTGVGWALFLIFSLNALRLGRVFSNLGLIGPLALVILLVVGDVLVLTAFLDIVPERNVVTDSIEHGLRDFLPFVEENT